MSAGVSGDPKVQNSLDLLAPKFKEAILAGLIECRKNKIDAYVYESLRSEELAKLYYARGRTIIPPSHTVTNAPNQLYSWHGYGLAVDIISRSKGWNQPRTWFEDMAACFINRGCSWGGDWHFEDLPHIQWGKCKPSPSDLARTIIAAHGMNAVWIACGAD